MGSTQETERTLASDPRSQGDIIAIESEKDQSHPRLGVVINADCDLAHERLDGVITYLPIYTFKEYVENFWAPDHVEERKSSATAAILQLIGDEEAEAISLSTWLNSAGPEVVHKALVQSLDLKKRQSEQLERDVAKLYAASDGEIPSLERFYSLCRLEKDPQGFARKQLGAAKKAMGEGHFMISEVVGHNALGFVIRMRRTYSLPEKLYFRSTAEQLAHSSGDEITAVRVCRLSELYRVKVLQLFAQQFSRIGLPDEITALSGLAIDDLVEAVERPGS